MEYGTWEVGGNNGPWEAPSCSAWTRLVTRENNRFIITSRNPQPTTSHPNTSNISNTFEPIETERFYCEPEDDSMSDDKGGYSSGTPGGGYSSAGGGGYSSGTPVGGYSSAGGGGYSSAGGGYSSGTPVVAPPEEFQDSQTSLSTSPSPPKQSLHSGTSPGRSTWCRAPSPVLIASHHYRPSSSHNSLSRRHHDDSTFIKSAISHDTITDLYNVPVGSDIYTLPVDTIPRPTRLRKKLRDKRRRRYTSTGSEMYEKERKCTSTVTECTDEPVHMTLQEVRQFLHNLYSSGDNDFAQKHKESKQKNSLGYLLKKALCSVFRLKGKSSRHRDNQEARDKDKANESKVILLEAPRRIVDRALPPLPTCKPSSIISVPTLTSHPHPTHFAASLDRVKDCGWYWGPVSGESAEKILANEPDGSFIVRDSSDDHYIFSLTFRLNGTVRHVRIEHDQGNFSFGSCTKFKSQTIVDFIETAVEHSRSGRYLFFLHRRPVLGPMRVQLLHPVSRFKHIQSLQHLARFVIVKTVRRDLIEELPLPRRLIDYLKSPHYYSEQLAHDIESNNNDADNSTTDVDDAHSPVHLVSFAPPPPTHL